MARRTQHSTIPPKFAARQAIPLLKRQLDRLENEIIKLPHNAPEVTAWEQRTTMLLDDIFGQPNGARHSNTNKFAQADSGLPISVTPYGGYYRDDSQERYELRQRKRAALLRAYIEELEDLCAIDTPVSAEDLPEVQTLSQKHTGKKKVFIGHGHSHQWRELKDFLNDRLDLDWDEFNREPAAGFPTAQRLQTMLEEADFAFLVLTAEDEHLDGTVHPRENVIHEAGLFQGKLGFQRAIILREDGCTEFSNIHGLTQIPFPNSKIWAAFEEIRRVLEREGILAKSQAQEPRPL